MTNPFGLVADAAEEHFAAWHPESPGEFDEGMAGIRDLYERLGAQITQLAERLGSDYPIEPAVVDALAEVGSNTTAMGEYAHEAYTTHRAAHENEMRREEDPRPGEEMWNIKG